MSAPKIEIPTINVREYFGPSSPASKDEAVKQIRDACLRHGFFQLVGHGVPLEVQQGMLRGNKKFFDFPLEQKRGLSLYKNSWRRGYEALGEQRRGIMR